MSDKIEALRELAEKASENQWGSKKAHYTEFGLRNFHEVATPTAILSLLSELDRLRSENEAMRKALEPFRECVVMTDRNRVIIGFETDKIAAQVADALADYVEGSQS